METYTGGSMSIRVFNDLASACDYCEVIPERIPTHGQLIRVSTVAHNRSKNGYMREFPDGAIFIGNWENGLEAIFSERSNRRLTKAEKEIIRHEREREQREAERAQRMTRESVYRRLYAFFNSDFGAYPSVNMEWHGSPKHPYLERKAVELTETIYECTRENFEAVFGSNYQRLPDGRLLVFPLVRDGLNLVSAQFIDERGNKYFLRNGEMKGAYWPATFNPVDRGASPKIHIAEGVATLLSVLQKSEQRSGIFISCMNAGNIKPVAKAMREQYPLAEIVLYADVDKPRDGHRYGVGIEKALEAQLEVPNLTILAPPFTEADNQKFRKVTGSEKAPTDWNDFYLVRECA